MNDTNRPSFLRRLLNWLIILNPFARRPGTDFDIPPEVSSILDRADMEGDKSALIGNGTISLASKDGQTVYETVQWKNANEFARRVLKKTLGGTT